MIGLDYETYSDVNLKVHGLEPYMASENFRVLMASVDDGEGGIGTFDFVFNCYREQDAMADEMEFFRRGIDNEFLNTLEEGDNKIVAHNAPFERGVTERVWPGIIDWRRFVDSAVAARGLGADSKLLLASRQLTNSHKMEEGAGLIQRFCVPNDLYPEGPTAELIEKHGDMDKWLLFIKYCEMDATAGLDIYKYWLEMAERFDLEMVAREELFEQPTYVENINGWYVDLPLVKQMKNRGWANSVIAKKKFVLGGGAQLNFNSTPQMKQYCQERGYPVKSLDKYNRPVHIRKLKAKIKTLDAPDNGPQLKKAVEDLKDVLLMIETKSEIGGSALSKLPKIEELVSADGRLRHQYVHVGAGQTFRTAARGVQLQNIKRLGNDIKDMETVYDYSVPWSNTEMADQVRQVFKAESDEGKMLVGDFSGVESRGLAYQAGEDWKLQAFRDGKDVYCVLVTRFQAYTHLTYEEVVDKEGEYYKTLRPRGKYSELSCGYQASGKAVKNFMYRLGFDISLEEGAQNVNDWRGANPHIVDYWHGLDIILRRAIKTNRPTELPISYGMLVRVTPFALPSMQAQHPGALSACVQILIPDEHYVDGRKKTHKPYVTRFIHGLYFKDVEGSKPKLCYYKPADTLGSGDLWTPDYADPDGSKNKVTGKTNRFLYGIYGGKLAGILTQSLCREMFMESSVILMTMLEKVPNAKLVGQFHDELVVEWNPMEAGYTEDHVKHLMTQAMTNTRLQGFPLDAEIKSAHRYIK